jgi:hypothetical protein
MHHSTARSMWQVYEPIHAITYFAPEARAATDGLGLKGGWMGYFAGRAAPMGAVPAEVVIATFFNFHPDMVRRSIPDAWRLAAPEDIVEARQHAVDRALRRIVPDVVDSPELSEAASLLRRAVEACEPYGRPLYAANSALEWPEEPHLALWSAATRLREHRGDGHVASLVGAGLDGCEAHVTVAALGTVPAEMQRSFRWWSEEEWSAAAGRLWERGWLEEDGRLTVHGHAERARLEAATDRLAMGPWDHLGPASTKHLFELLLPIAGRLMGEDNIPIPNPMALPWPPTPIFS